MPRGRPHKCIYCGSIDTVSKGSRVTKTLGIRKIRRCKSCGRKFTPKSQKLIPIEGNQANEAQAESVNEDPSEESVSTEPEDSAANAQNKTAEMTQQADVAPDEPEKPLPADSATAELTESEQPTHGY